MQDINKKEGFSHPFFLKFAGFVWARSVSLLGVEKVSKSVQATKNLYPFFSFILFLVYFWQTMTGKRNRTPYATIPACDR